MRITTLFAVLALAFAGLLYGCDNSVANAATKGGAPVVFAQQSAPTDEEVHEYVVNACGVTITENFVVPVINLISQGKTLTEMLAEMSAADKRKGTTPEMHAAKADALKALHALDGSPETAAAADAALDKMLDMCVSSVMQKHKAARKISV